MSGRPRGRPRKDGSAPQPRPKVVKEIEDIEEEDEPATTSVSNLSTRRSSPRKRKPANFDDFVVEAPGLGVIGEGADIIKEIEEDELFEDDIMPKEEAEDDYQPGDDIEAPPVKPKRKYTKRAKKQGSVGMEGDLVRMDDIEDDIPLDDPMRRVERRGRKKKNREVIEDAPVLMNESGVVAPPLKVTKKEKTAQATASKETINEDGAVEGETEKDKEHDDQPQEASSTPVSPRKSPRGSPVKPPTATFTAIKTTSSSRRKQIMTGNDDEEFGHGEEVIEEEVHDDMMEELVDVESFEVQTMPQRMEYEDSMSPMIHSRMQNKPFKCTECGAAYRREAYLLNHLANVHRDECAILSSAERSAKRAERRPQIMIPKERPGEAAYKFGCDLCDRRFLRWEGLVVHQKQIHKEVTQEAKDQEKNRDYGAQCPVCLLYFFGNHALSEHVSKEHPDHNRFIFACDICKMGFMHWARVRAHKTQIHNVPVKYTQGYLKKNPEMAKIVEAQRMRKAVERNRAKRLLEKGLLTGEAASRDFHHGLSHSEMKEYMYLMPPQLEPMLGEREEYEDDDPEEEIVEEEGIIDPDEMMNIRMVPLPTTSVRRLPLPPRLMGYRDHYNRGPPRVFSRGHQLSSIHQRVHQRVTQLDRNDLAILNRRLPSEIMRGSARHQMPKEEEDLEIDVEREEEMVEEEVVEDDLVMDGEEHEEMEEEEVEGIEEEEDDNGELPPQLDLYE